jgi:F-type H+-transporting ATPase subunit delta
LFEVAVDLKDKSNYLTELRAVDELVCKNNEVFNFFKSVEVSAEDKVKILEKSFKTNGISSNVLNTVKIIVERNKVSYLSKILLAYQSLNDEANGVVRGVVRSSHELDDTQRKSMSQKIESVLNKKVILEYIKDSKVIGGVKAQVGSYTFDDTFETHLKKMKDQINRRTH